jgi:gas vesicle protein GvpG
MGLFTGLLTLPLAPVRGTMWVAEKLYEAAEQEANPDVQFRARLETLQIAYELGELTDEDYEQAEQELVEQFEGLRPPLELPQEVIDDGSDGPAAEQGEGA